MANNNRTFTTIVTGIWIRLLTIIIPFTFPAHLTTFLHRLRGVKIGKGSKINRTVQIDDSFPHLIEIGENVWVTGGVMLICHQRDLNHYEIGKPVMDCPFKISPIIIEDGVHIGIGAIVLPGVTIGEGSVIGAGSIVSRDIPSHCVAVGSPAKAIRFIGR